MRVLVTGADGQLGKAVVEVLGRRGHEIIPTNKRNMDITDERAVEDIFLREIWMQLYTVQPILMWKKPKKNGNFVEK